MWIDAYLLANKTKQRPPDPWDPVPRSQWTSGVVYPRYQATFSFKYKIWKYQNNQWIYQDEWVEKLYNRMPITRVANTGNGALIHEGNYQGMIPGLFYIDDTGINVNNTHVDEYMVSPLMNSGEALAISSITYLDGVPNFYLSGYGLGAGTYKLDIVRYYGRPHSYYYNDQISDTIKVEGLKTTYYDYGENDKFYFDPEIKEFNGYRGPDGTSTPYRKGHVVTLTESHIFEIPDGWSQVIFNSIGLQTFCDGIRHVNYDIDGQEELSSEHHYASGSYIPMIYLIDFNLFRMK